MKYDRAITTFSADGRLQQVEYGMEAANRGDSVVAALINETMAIVAVRGTDKVHRVDSHVLLVTAGLAGDGRALAATLRSSCQRHILSYGEPPTVHEVSHMAARVQHELTRTAGARPLGCTAIVIGVKASNGDTPGEVQIYQTDPGGVLEQCSYCVAGKRKTQILKSLADAFGEASNNSQAFAFDITSKTLSLLSNKCDDDDSSCKDDLWIVRAEYGKRGYISLLCAKGIDAESLNDRLPFLRSQ